MLNKIVYVLLSSRFNDFYVLALVLDFIVNKYATGGKRCKLQHF